jgi:S1-C subfamily serine protease
MPGCQNSKLSQMDCAGGCGVPFSIRVCSRLTVPLAVVTHNWALGGFRDARSHLDRTRALGSPAGDHHNIRNDVIFGRAMLDRTPTYILDRHSPAADQSAPSSGHIDDGLLDAYSQAVTTVVDRVAPAVARVEPGASGRTAGMGFGVVISPDGLVLTNSHVMQGAREARLTLSDGRVLAAQALGNDPDTDLALLRANSDGLPFAVLGDSKRLKRGQIAVAIGSPLGFESTVTAGLVWRLGGACAPNPAA